MLVMVCRVSATLIPVIGLLRPFETQINVNAVLLDVLTLDADEVADATVAVDGELICAVLDDNAANTDADDRPALNTRAPAELVASGTATVTDGVASFSFDGLADDDDRSWDDVRILTEWVPAEDSPYDITGFDDGEITNFGGVPTADHGLITFTDEEPIGFEALRRI